MGRTSCGTGKRFVMCPRYCEIFGPRACAGVFDEKECVMSTYREESLPETLQDMSDRFGKPFERFTTAQVGHDDLHPPKFCTEGRHTLPTKQLQKKTCGLPGDKV